MSDTTPIYPSASAPPSYTEAEAHPLASTVKEESKPLAARAPKDAPPPYEYPPQCPPCTGYQRFGELWSSKNHCRFFLGINIRS